MLKSILLGLSLLVFNISAFAQTDAQIFRTITKPSQIKIMAYNVHNLFDADHDSGKNDFKFLPKNHPQKSKCSNASCKNLDWSNQKVVWKLQTIRRALSLQGSLPDILVLSEVENPRVVTALARGLGYDGYRMTNSPDQRGIDLAVLFKTTKLKLMGFEEVPVKGTEKPTRNASAVHFEILKNNTGKKDVIGIYPAHWPSQAGKTPNRIAAARTMVRLIHKYSEAFQQTENYNYHAIALGDFNSLRTERPHPITTTLQNPNWAYRMYDTEQMARAKKIPVMRFMPKGTYFFGRKKTWNKFDRILLSKSLLDNDGVEVKLNSFRIHAPALLSSRNSAGERVPLRYNHSATDKSKLGFSDHYAVHVILDL